MFLSKKNVRILMGIIIACLHVALSVSYYNDTFGPLFTNGDLTYIYEKTVKNYSHTFPSFVINTILSLFATTVIMPAFPSELRYSLAVSGICSAACLLRIAIFQMKESVKYPLGIIGIMICCHIGYNSQDVHKTNTSK